VICQAHLIAVVGVLLMGCAVLLMVVGCAGVRSQAPQKEEQARSDRCEGTRTLKKNGLGVYTTNDVPGCPKGGLLSGTDKKDQLDGKDGDDEIRGLGATDFIDGGGGNDVIYGGPGDETWLSGDDGDDVLYGGVGNDRVIGGGAGEDVLYGGKGNDRLDGDDQFVPPAGREPPMRDELYCGPGKDQYHADGLDYVDSSCEEKVKVWGGIA
jgi:Ca2+-binding RTX toxin-like protein